MSYLGYEQVTVDGTARDGSTLSIPSTANGAEIQAETQNGRYTMDGTNPTESTGMLFLTTEGPKYFVIDDVRRMKWIQTSAGAGVLNIHYVGGRADL